jgi:4-hydroxy-tetrahydrodipicolinate synthase
MIKGSIVALVTPMLNNGDIDWQALTDLLDMHLEAGTHGIVAVGTTGESATLSVAEHCQVIKHTVEHIKGRIPVVAGTGANCTREAIELTQAAKDAGADACLLVTPYYNKPTQQGLYLHHKAIAEAVAIPQILYNVPGRTVCDMHNETVDRLASIDNIVAIKDATGDLVRGKALIDICAGRIDVLSGDDATAVELTLLGGKGDISVTANVAPVQMAKIYEAALAGDGVTARALNDKLMPLHRDLFVESSPIPVKWALEQLGKIQGGIRLPLTPLNSDYHAVVRAAMEQSGIA